MSQWQPSFGVCFAALLCALAARASESKFIGSQSCNSTSCHGRSEPRKTSLGNAGPGLQEFQLYVRHDPHANAARTLMTPEFQAILSRLCGTESGISRAASYQQCAECHDPEGMTAAKVEHAELTPPEIGHSAAGRGIGCETCHGGAKEWLTTHYQRDASRSSLVSAGMRDTKDLAVRAALCASCHVGSAGRDVNHDLLAAGHPPLRFELAAYHRKLTSHDSAFGKASHWNDARDRIQTEDFEIKLWAAGQYASAQASLALLENRAHGAMSSSDEPPGPATWPEFAEYDCFACHQRLRPQLGEKRPGPLAFPAWGKWNLAPLELAGEVHGLSALREEMNRGFSTRPLAAEHGARKARESLLPRDFLDRANPDDLLDMFRQPVVEDATWEVLCQRYLALRAMQKSCGDEFQKLELAGRITALQRREFNELRSAVNDELRAIGQCLSFADDRSEWPKIFSEPNVLEQTKADLTTAVGKVGSLRDYLKQRR